jgi:hypothetical protein
LMTEAPGGLASPMLAPVLILKGVAEILTCVEGLIWIN